MKKTLTVIIAAVLCVLMALPFAMMTSADTIDLTRPVASGTDKVYVAYGTIAGVTTVSYTGGNTADAAYPLLKDTKNNNGGGWGELFATNTTLHANRPTTVQGNTDFTGGGTVVIVGKGALTSASYTFPATTAPLVFTGKDGDTSYISKTPEGELDYMTASGANSGQCGMFMTDPEKTITFAGDVIFRDTVFLNRQNAESASTKAPTIYSVQRKFVVEDTVQFASMMGNAKYTLNVESTGVAFLDALGFGKYTGTGAIVVGDGVLAQATQDVFTGFEGIVYKADGTVLYDMTPADTSADTTTTQAPDTTAAADTTTTAAGDTTAAPDTTTTAAETTTAAPETTAPAKVEVPAKPTAPTNKIYTAFTNNPDLNITASGNGDGSLASDPFKANPTTKWTELTTTGLAKDGGVIVLVGKGYIGTDFTFPATTTPLMFTAKDGDTNYTSMKDGQIYFQENNGNAGQYGMFMIINGKTLTFEGDVIFDNVVILSRLRDADVDKGTEPANIVVKKSIVITNTVQYANMSGNKNYNLVVESGAYAYIDALGFESYQGKGTIVVGDSIKNTVKASDFAGFEGYIVDSEGNHLFTTGGGQGTTNTGDSAVFVAIIALSAVACGAVLTMKKSRV